jgi:hypothetical protein
MQTCMKNSKMNTKLFSAHISPQNIQRSNLKESNKVHSKTTQYNISKKSNQWA